MTRDEAEKVVGAPCQRDHTASKCYLPNSNDEFFILSSTQFTDPETVYMLSLVFCSDNDEQAVADDLGHTYGVSGLGSGKSVVAGHYTFGLGRNGFCKRGNAYGNAFIMFVQDNDVRSRDEKAQSARIITPKF